MKIKHITRIRFTTRWALQNQRNLTIGNRLLGKVIIDDQRIHTIVHEELTHRCTREGRDILVGRIIASRRRNDNGVFHRASFLEYGNGASDVRILLTNSNVDRINRTEVFREGAILIAVLVVDLPLIDDGINRDRCLTS